MVEGLHVSFMQRKTAPVLRKRSISLHCVLILWIMAAWAVPGMSQSAAPANPVASLAIDPTTPTTLYAGTPIGVFKSTNGGITWSVPAMAMNVTSIAIDPSYALDDLHERLQKHRWRSDVECVHAPGVQARRLW